MLLYVYNTISIAMLWYFNVMQNPMDYTLWGNNFVWGEQNLILMTIIK